MKGREGEGGGVFLCYCSTIVGQGVKDNIKILRT